MSICKNGKGKVCGLPPTVVTGRTDRRYGGAVRHTERGGIGLFLQWLSHHWEDVENDRSDLIVIDEAHRALAETYNYRIY